MEVICREHKDSTISEHWEAFQQNLLGKKGPSKVLIHSEHHQVRMAFIKTQQSHKHEHKVVDTI